MSNYGYVTLLMGDTLDFLANIVLMQSLINSGAKYDRVLLYTFVPKYKLDILAKYYTRMIEVDKNFVKTPNPETNDIFTLLNIFTLKDYDKVLYLCNNMYVNKNIDIVFTKYEAPAGLANNQKYGNGEKVR